MHNQNQCWTKLLSKSPGNTVHIKNLRQTKGKHKRNKTCTTKNQWWTNFISKVVYLLKQCLPLSLRETTTHQTIVRFSYSLIRFFFYSGIARFFFHSGLARFFFNASSSTMVSHSLLFVWCWFEFLWFWFWISVG